MVNKRKTAVKKGEKIYSMKIVRYVTYPELKDPGFSSSANRESRVSLNFSTSCSLRNKEVVQTNDIVVALLSPNISSKNPI